MIYLKGILAESGHAIIEKDGVLFHIEPPYDLDRQTFIDSKNFQMAMTEQGFIESNLTFDSLDQLTEYILQENEKAQRTGFRTNYAFLAGMWIPMGDLALLGNHPSLGFQVGARDNSNQLDFTLQFRFSKSANTYTINRNNGFYDLNNYFGGYIGLDYAHYLVNKINFDLGLFGGMGYDGFDITSSNYNYDDLKPLSIGSFNANAGVKLNYFLTTSFYIGLQARYNFINYINHGGTSMAGDAFSIDLIIGGNKKVNR